MIGQDDVGRIAIRLGRAYNQGWAKAIPSDAKWNWETARDYIVHARTKRPPAVLGDAIRFEHDDSATSWTVAPTLVRVVSSDTHEGVQSVVEADLPGGTPRVTVTLTSFAAMKEAAIWRADRALTSVCGGPWQPLHRLTPLVVIARSLPEYIPTEPTRLLYLGDRIRSSSPELDAAMSRLGSRFFTSWASMAIR